MSSKSIKPVEWVGSSYKDFRSFPDLVQDSMGFALYMAQIGRMHGSAKPLKGFGGAGVVEVVDDHVVVVEPALAVHDPAPHPGAGARGADAAGEGFDVSDVHDASSPVSSGAAAVR